MNKYIEYFNTLNSADLHIIDNYPWCGRIEETDLNLFSKETGKIVVEEGKGKIIKISKIVYTASSKLPEVTDQSSHGLHINAFNVSIIDHSFSNGQGIITFAGKVTNIGDYAFYDCSYLTSITIPNSVTSIGNKAFSGCSSLTSIIIPNNVTRIDTYTFFRCTSLFSVTIPNSVTSIGYDAFSFCTSLASVIIGNSVTNIDHYAFECCSALTSITSKAVIPPICGIDCFRNVDKSIPVYVPAESISAYQAADRWKEFTNFQSIPSE